MKAYLKEIKFPSTEPTYIKNITSDIQSTIKKSKVKNGFSVISSKHTTLGIIVHEISETNLLQDIIKHSLTHVPEDKRSERAQGGYKHPVTDYKHRCQDNPYCDEIDIDYNAGSHIRALTLSHSSITIPIRNGKLELGKYQEVAVFEFDGRDGKGINPIRQRTVQIWITPVEDIEVLN